ncbi:MAG: histidinol dehydrogenase [Spirochaetales bacterium]|nr:histidinol dehydrogenase [Spirochaetales bacterium]
MYVQILRWKEITEAVKHRLLSRSESDIEDSLEKVRPILQEVQARGDEALRKFTHDFDQVDLKNLPLRVSFEEFRKAEASLPNSVKDALHFAIQNVWKFHETQKPASFSWVEVRPGIYAGEKGIPLPSVGLYVPRGRGSFPSMLYMMAVPARIAGVPEIRIVTPPDPDGFVDAACLYAAEQVGVTEVYRVGGAQAIGALAYGTESIRKVAKILGPGSRYVAAAKRLVSDRVDTGLPAGPSESIIIADRSADPRLVALDLLIEAEHGSDSAALLVTPDISLAEEVKKLLGLWADQLPEPRRTFVQDVFSRYGGIVLTESLDEAVQVVNQFAPEHLQLQVSSPLDLLGKIQHAGEILLGSTTPFSVANYAVGANAVLPTGGKACTYSAVSVRDFLKYSSVIHVSPQGFSILQDPVQILAEYEGFPAHARALKYRTESGSYKE